MMDTPIGGRSPLQLCLLGPVAASILTLAEPSAERDTNPPSFSLDALEMLLLRSITRDRLLGSCTGANRYLRRDLLRILLTMSRIEAL